jgi:hypothetical protein
MKPLDIREEYRSIANECPNGMSGLIVLVGEIAAQLAETNQHLAELIQINEHRKTAHGVLPPNTPAVKPTSETRP